MIGTIGFFSLIFFGGACAMLGVHYERWQVRQEQRRGYDPDREWN